MLYKQFLEWQIQVLLFETVWNFFFFWIVLTHSWSHLPMQNLQTQWADDITAPASHVQLCSEESIFNGWAKCVLSRSVVSDSLWPPWSAAYQAPLSMGILQAGILECVATTSSKGSFQLRDWTQVSCIASIFFTIWATRKAQEYWSGLPFPSPGDLPDPGVEPESPTWQADSLSAELPFSHTSLLL